MREGVYSFGAPVFGASGEAVAAISVCINKAQLGSDRGSRHRDAALAVAADLSRGSAATPGRRGRRRSRHEAAGRGDLILETRA